MEGGTVALTIAPEGLRLPAERVTVRLAPLRCAPAQVKRWKVDGILRHTMFFNDDKAGMSEVPAFLKTALLFFLVALQAPDIRPPQTISIRMQLLSC